MNNLLDWFNGLRRRLRFAYCYYRAHRIVSKARAAAPSEFDPVCIWETVATSDAFFGTNIADDFLGGIFGRKPNVPDFEPIDLQLEQREAILGNIENWPLISEMGDLYQKYMMEGYEKAFPGFKQLLGLGEETTRQMFELSKEMMGGELPKDVADYVRRNAAQAGLTSGLMGSPAGQTIAPRDLGLTSLQMQKQGADMATIGGNALQRFTGIAANTIMSPAGWVVTPAQQAEMTLTNRLIEHNIEQQRENIKAARDPVMGGLSDIVLTLTSAYLGGGAGGAKSTATPQDRAAMGGGSGGGLNPAPSSWSQPANLWGPQGMSVAPAPNTQMLFNPVQSYEGPGYGYEAGNYSTNFNWNPGGGQTLWGGGG